MQMLGALYLTLAASIWGGMYVASKYVLDYIPPLTLLAMRLAIAGVILGVAAWVRGEWRARPQDRLFLFSLGFVGFTLSLGFQFWGTKLSTAHNGGLITSASPAFIVLFAILLLRERPTWHQWAALGLASVGVLAVIGPESDTSAGSSLWLGNLYLVGAGLTWGLYTVMGKMASRSYPALTVTLYATISGFGFTAPLAYLTEQAMWQPFPSIPVLAWWGVAYVGVISTAVAFYLWNKGFSMMDASPASFFFFAQPLVAAVLGSLLLNETLHWYFFLGAILILAGLIFSAFGSRTGRT